MAEDPVFYVNEIAIINYPLGSLAAIINGREVTVTGPLEFDPIGGDMAYPIEAPWLSELPQLKPGDRWRERPRNLRKRRPDPDWRAIADVTDIKEPEPA